MKIAICGDIHWCQYSSIMRDRGKNFSLRLEYLINSVNWFNKLSTENSCFANFYLGDFFDKAELNAEELSALSQIKWGGCSQYFLCGNHEMLSVDHTYSSAKVFNLLDIGEVLEKPQVFTLADTEIAILPYVLESNRKTINEYLPIKTNKKRILLSHNDIAGIQMGKFVSETGFTIDELETAADLVINGHLHNGEKISNKIINIGILCGMNFSEDALRYDHCAFIIDMDTLKIEVYENPYAFNFYKIDIANKKFPTFKDNSIVSFKCKESFVEELKNYIEKTPTIIKHRITIEPELLNKDTTEFNTEDLTVDHLARFRDYIHEKLGDSSIVNYEIGEICK